MSRKNAASDTAASSCGFSTPFVGEHMEAKKSKAQSFYKVNLGGKRKFTSMLAVMFSLKRHEITHNQRISTETHIKKHLSSIS